MTCKQINTDPLSDKLKAITPSGVANKSVKIKKANVEKAFNSAVDDINSKVSAAVQNVKNLKTGAIPLPKIPDLNPVKFLEPIDKKLQATLSELVDVRSELLNEKSKITDMLNSQLECTRSAAVSRDELAAMQGDLFKDIAGSAKSLTNNQLRNFNQDIDNQLQTVKDITSNIIEIGKQAANSGSTIAEKADRQVNAMSNLELLAIQEAEQEARLEAIKQKNADNRRQLDELAAELTAAKRAGVSQEELLVRYNEGVEAILSD